MTSSRRSRALRALARLAKRAALAPLGVANAALGTNASLQRANTRRADLLAADPIPLREAGRALLACYARGELPRRVTFRSGHMHEGGKRIDDGAFWETLPEAVTRLDMCGVYVIDTTQIMLFFVKHMDLIVALRVFAENVPGYGDQQLADGVWLCTR